jgi:hypothetical protein
MPDLAPEDQLAGFTKIGETLRELQDAQRSGIERLEAKATLILGFLAAAVPLYAAQDHTRFGLRITAFVFYGLAAGAGLFVSLPYRSREVAMTANAERFVQTPQSPMNLGKWLIKERVYALGHNHDVSVRKAGGTWLCLTFLVFAASFSVASLWR